MPFKEHALFEPPPNPSAPIFRYMDLAKFVSLLDTRALVFARADLLGDAFEGSVTQANMRLRPEWTKKLAATAIAELDYYRHQAPRWTFVNCWTASPTESVAMWRLYVGAGNGLAVESSYERLVSALGGKRDVYVGTVKYVDWQTEAIPEGNLLVTFLHKRAGFDYEREVRAIVSDVPQKNGVIDKDFEPPPGLPVPVDVRRLIARVRLSPVADRWYHQVVRSLIAKYGYKLEVVQSDLSGEPVF
ncbi:MAG: hypothetical protein ABSA21_12995 [Candidatus Limnocylindrales bacterium]